MCSPWVCALLYIPFLYFDVLLFSLIKPTTSTCSEDGKSTMDVFLLFGLDAGLLIYLCMALLMLMAWVQGFE